MEFIESGDHEGRTNYHAPLPPDHRLLLLPGFNHQYVSGPWGWYLSQWIETEVFTFWIQYIHRNYKGRMYAQVNHTIYTLHHLVAGTAIGSLNGSQPVELSFDRSHFFIIPGGRRQEVTLEKGLIVSMHADFKREYLDRNMQHYQALLPLLQQYDNDPGKAMHEISVMHNHLLEHPWRRIFEMLPKVSNPVLYLEAQVRELLREHYERLMYKPVGATVSAIEGNLTETQLQAVRQAAAIIEKDITESIPIQAVAYRAGINASDLKRLFKDHYGITPYRYLVRLRMELARELLLSTDKPNSEIALLCGIRNTSQFIQLFRKHYKVTPKVFRITKGKPPS